MKTHKFLFKGSWRGTSLKFWIEAPNINKAFDKAERYIRRMEGNLSIIDLEVLESTDRRFQF